MTIFFKKKIFFFLHPVWYIFMQAMKKVDSYSFHKMGEISDVS